MMRDPDPCDECGQAPAVVNGLCGACWDRLKSQRGHEDGDWSEYDDTDEDYDESAWHNWRTREPR